MARKRKISITKTAECPITFRFGDRPSKTLSYVDGGSAIEAAEELGKTHILVPFVNGVHVDIAGLT